MMDFITAPLVVGICVLGIYKLFELYARRRERLALIDKLDPNISCGEQNIKLPDYSTSRFSFNALKIGCLLVGIGLGLLIGFILCMKSIPDYINSARSWEVRQISSMVYGSSVLFLGGVGLIVAFVIEIKMSKKDKKEA